MIALAGYRNESSFFVKYRYGEKTLYAGGTWRDTVELIENPAPSPVQYVNPSLVPMQYHQEAPWEPLPKNVIRLPVLGVEK